MGGKKFLVWAILIFCLLAKARVGAYTAPLLTQEPDDVVAVVGSPVTLICKSSGSPGPQYKWFKDDQEIESNSGRSVSSDGTLTIASYESSRDAGMYRCHALVEKSEDQAPLSLASRQASVSSLAFPDTFASDLPSSTTGYGQGNTRMSVSTSNFNPAPTIAWNYRGKPSIQNNDPRFTVLPQGVLQINGLSSDDNGEIRAIALNKKTGEKVMGQFGKLQVKAASKRPSDRNLYFLGKPISTTIASGYSTILEAFVDSNQPATYTWYKDGSPLALDDRHVIFGQGNLKILFADDADAGTYKVVVQAGGKSVEASAQLNVISERQVLKVPPKRVEAEEAQTRVNFQIDGNPKLDWYHDNVKIDEASTDYMVFGSDYVTFDDLILQDGGMWQGRVGNTKSVITFELVVIEKGTAPVLPTILAPVINQQPGKAQNFRAQTKSSSSIFIEWDPPSVNNGAIINYQVTVVDSSFATASKLTYDGTDRSATVSNLNPDTLYKFHIQAENSNGMGAVSNEVQAQTMKSYPQTIGAVTNLNAANIQGDEITLLWDQPPGSSSLDITTYEVFYKEKDTQQAPMKSESLDTAVKISNLQPGKSYIIWVVANGQSGPGLKSTEITVDIPKTVVTPPQPVTQLAWKPKLTRMVMLTWKPNPNGPTPTGYAVFFKNLADLSKETRMVDSPPANIDGLTPNTPYEFFVIPFIDTKPGLKSNVITVRTNEEAPTAPASLDIVSIGSKHIKLRWQPIDMTSFKGTLKSYKLQYFKTSSRQSINSKNSISKTSTEIMVKDLQPETSYTFFVQGIGGGGEKGMKSPMASATTRVVTTDGPTEPALFAGVHNPDAPDMLMLTWDEPLYNTGDIANYVVYYRQTGETDWLSKTTLGTAKGVNITAIDFGKRYESYVVATDSNGIGAQSSAIGITTLTEISKPGPVINLQLKATADSLAVNWDPPSGDVIVRGYDIIVVDVASGAKLVKKDLYGRQNRELVLYNGIEPTTEYKLTVRANNTKGFSIPEEKSAKTLAAPKSAILIESFNTGENNVFFKWTDNGAPPGTKYLVKYEVYDVNGVPETKTVSVSRKEVTIGNLTPYTMYNFHVKRVAYPAFPKQQALQVLTAEAVPSEPLDVTAQSVGEYPTWLILSWQVPRYPNGKIITYLIRYSTDKTLALSEWPKITTAAISMTHNITELTAGTKYYFVVYAVNGAGVGKPSAIYSKTTVGGTGIVIIDGKDPGHHHADAGGLALWWIILAIVLFIILLLLLLLLLWCCCCRKKGALTCMSCCPCCEKTWLKCCLPCCLCCCPCFCKKRKNDADMMEIASPVLTVTTNEKLNGHAAYKAEHVEMIPLTSAVDGGPMENGHLNGTIGSIGSKGSAAGIKVAVPGDATFISYKTSLQDYRQKAGLLAPAYTTYQYDMGCKSKVGFGSYSYDSGSEFGTSRHDAEQRAAHVALVALNVLDFRSKYNSEACIAVPGQGDTSFISYKCSLHDFCQQCNIDTPVFITNPHSGGGYSSSVTVGNHTFTMVGRTDTSHGAEQKVASVALHGLCMVESQAVYDPHACFTVASPGDAQFVSFKSSLHDFCQRYRLPPPQYITNQASHGFSAKLKFGGLFFQSSDYFQSRLEAEQHAAFEALQGLGLLESCIQFSSASWDAQSNTSMLHGSGMVQVGIVGGGGVSSTYNSRQTSRQHSTHASRQASRSQSRQGSLPGSRRGSLGNIADIYDVQSTSSTRLAHPGGLGSPPAAPRDPAFTLGQRSYSSGSGFNNTSSSARNNVHYSTVGRTASTSNYSSGYSSNTNSTYQQQHQQQGHQQQREFENYDTLPSTSSYLETTERYDNDYYSTPTKPQTSTLPRNNNRGGSSSSTTTSHVRMGSNSFSHTSYKGSRSYSGSARDLSYLDYHPPLHTNRTTSHPALSDLESEMAGLEGLIKDLNGITGPSRVV